MPSYIPPKKGPLYPESLLGLLFRLSWCTAVLLALAACTIMGSVMLEVGVNGGGARSVAGFRPEAGLTKALPKRAASGGCHGLLFGLESGSQRRLNRMRKGIDLGAVRGAVLSTASASRSTQASS